ncbi:MAG: sugar phosphate isomerase/epimerase [Verrucomicrobia bacterium]|nr:sugar phosphate isomerase/epimerase [Verrucomicrobiota bacterium]
MHKPRAIPIGNQTAFSALTPTQPFDYALARGFDAFEWFPDKKPDGRGWEASDLSAAQRHAIREVAQARGVRLSVHARCQAQPLEPPARRLLLEDLRLAKDLGAVLLNIHLSVTEGVAAYVQAITWLLDRSSDEGVDLAIENTPLTTPQDLNRLFAELRDLDSVPIGHVGMCLDLGHANLCPSTRNDYLDYVDQLDARVPIIHVHLHENWGDYDSHLPLFTGPAGVDPAGIRGFLKRLWRRHYTGSIILEQWPQPPALLDEARQRLIDWWRETSTEPARRATVPGRMQRAGV